MAKEQTPKQDDEPRKVRPQTLQILERRMKGVGLHGGGTPAIELKDPSMVCRWFNSKISDEHIWRARHAKGWEFVLPSDLADPEQIGGYTVSPEGYVCQGEKCEIKLMYMPKDARAVIERRKAEANIAAMDPHRQKTDVANAAGKAFGDQAGEFINQNVNLIGDIKTTKERIAVTPEAS